MVCGKIFPFGIFRFFKCDFYFIVIDDVDARKIKRNVKITADLHLIVMCRNHFILIQLSLTSSYTGGFFSSWPVSAAEAAKGDKAPEKIVTAASSPDTIRFIFLFIFMVCSSFQKISRKDVALSGWFYFFPIQLSCYRGSWPRFLCCKQAYCSCHNAKPGHLPDSLKGVPGHFYIPARSAKP